MVKLIMEGMETVKTWMARQLPGCADVTRTVSDSLDAPQGFRKWVGVRLHMLICEVCSRYEKQLKFIRKLLGRELPAESLPPEKKEQMRSAIRHGKS
ncbi:MAG: hypothetical protein JNM27_19005 [Leptospirales bacterium]|nr:hypothetical protein [Leptospirales bacterium]